jgi:hypothetical protein
LEIQEDSIYKIKLTKKINTPNYLFKIKWC